MTPIQLFDPATSTFTYIIGDSESGLAAIIDPVAEQVDRDLAALAEAGLELVYVLETHVHADHITGASLLRERTGARTVANVAGAPCADIKLDHGAVLELGALRIEALSTPGHTDDSMSFRVGDHVFTGDTLLIAGTGRTDFQNGDAGALWTSLQDVLFALADDTVVWPGHDYKGRTQSTIGAERRENPRVAGKTREEFIEIMNNLDLPPPKRLAESVPANRNCGRADQATL